MAEYHILGGYALQWLADDRDPIPRRHKGKRASGAVRFFAIWDRAAMAECNGNSSSRILENQSCLVACRISLPAPALQTPSSRGSKSPRFWCKFLKCMFLSGEKALRILGDQDRGP